MKMDLVNFRLLQVCVIGPFPLIGGLLVKRPLVDSRLAERRKQQHDTEARGCLWQYRRKATD